ncbi:hypothetical protein LIA77_02003 [Sarocladium implicatum]|nr:hypothetical protein LIA77_02003 [Sarocladium implicatum]
MSAPSPASPLQGLKVTLEEATPPSSDLIIIATVTNTNESPVTLLDYGSPLDSLALQLGLLRLTPEGAAEPLELPTIQLRRVWPPSRDSLVTIPTDGSLRNEIELKEPVVKVEELKGSTYRVKMEGRWQAVWMGEKGDVDVAALDEPGGDDKVF